MSRSRLLLALALLLAPMLVVGRAEAPPRGAATPRALMERFYDLTSARDYVGAANLVEPSKRSPEEVIRLVKRLRVVLDQYGPPEIDILSSSSDGELDDKLPPDRERMPALGDEPDGPGSVIMVRVDSEEGPRWLISRGTLARVDGWYRALPSRWLVERLPPMFARPGPFGLQLWQWLAVGGAIVLSFLGAFACARLTTYVLRALARRTKTRWDDLALGQLRGPLVFAWVLLLLRLLLPLAAIPERSLGIVTQGMRGALAAALFWAAIAAVEAVRVSLAHEALARPGQRALVGLGGRLLKMVLALIALVVVMAEVGFSVTSLLAGIGVGGLGLALAAQKTVENVFGAFSLGVDQPFREGDLIKVDGVTGSVESIGLRSTRIRTLDRTVVAIPNGKLAEMKTETLSARDRFRLQATLPLRPGTAVAAVRAVCDEAEAMLRQHPKVGVDVQARVTSITPQSTDVEVIASFLTTSGEEWLKIRQEMLLGLLEVVERAGTSLQPAPQSIELLRRDQ